MIKKFWGNNFGILREFSVDLEALTLLVGPNASGKSTFLRALRLIAMLTRMPLYGPKGLLPLGFRATVGDFLSPANPEQRLTLGIEAENDKGHGTYEITLGYCIFRSNSAAYSAACRPPIPRMSATPDHRGDQDQE